VINHGMMLDTMRTALLGLVVFDTGAANLSVTALGYERAVGSFEDEGFAKGMELTPSGFGVAGNNVVVGAPKVITAVTPTRISVNRTLTPEAANVRRLQVLLPTARAWENREFVPPQGTPWVKEEYLPGPMSFGANKWLLAEPMYVVKVNVPTDTGYLASVAYANAVLVLFKPASAFPMPNGNTLTVRGDVAPFMGQRLPNADHAGFSVVPVTVPFRCYTANF
jgi:hypothetical protein